MSDRAQALQQLKDLRETAMDARGLSVVFVFVLTYVGIIIGESTHEQIVRVSGLTLPLLSVEIPIVGFYVLTPLLVFFLHLNLLIQHYLLSQQVFTVSESLRTIDRSEELVRSLGHLPFVHWLLVRHGRGFKGLFSLAIHVAYIAWPLLTLLALQIAFLPYHHEGWTLVQQTVVLCDALLVAWLWPKVLDPYDRAFHWWCGAARPMARIAYRLRILPLRRDEEPGIPADDSSSVGSPTLLGLLIAFVVAWSATIALVPDSRMESSLLAILPKAWAPECGESKRQVFVPTCRLHEGEAAWMPRNLVLRDHVITANKLDPNIQNALLNESMPSDADLSRVIGIDLKNRNLRYADFKGSSLPKADLRGADMTGATFAGARLVAADFRPTVDRKGCAMMQSELRKEIDKSDFRPTVAIGADFRDAILILVRMQCANFAGSDFSGASLHAATIDGAQLYGSIFNGAKLHAALMRNANLNGSDLVRAQLDGVDAQNAALIAVDASGARFTGGRFYGARFAGAELGGVQLNVAELGFADMYEIKDEELRRSVASEVDHAVPLGIVRQSDKENIRELVRKRIETMGSMEPQLGSLHDQPCIGAPLGRYERYKTCKYLNPGDAVEQLRLWACTSHWAARALLHRMYVSPGGVRYDDVLQKLHSFKGRSCPELEQEMKRLREDSSLRIDFDRNREASG